MINNETYLISFETGSCGVFIKTMLEQIIAQDHIAYQEILEFPNAHAHDVNFFKRPLMDEHFYTFTATLYEGNVNSYESAIDADHGKPLIYRDHNAPNWELFFTKFINSKNIVITFTEEMEKYVATFGYYKYHINMGWDITDNILRWVGHGFPYSYKFPLIKPKEYAERIIEIKLEEILFDKQRVLDILSNISNRSVPTFVDKSYDNYVKAQREIFPNLF